ncbi:MAG: hypothetical protein LBW85_04830, partial [Deltaproteobacteria bacterium]|nr:hypothetical protein [Deltaproteobacteria bacterium]
MDWKITFKIGGTDEAASRLDAALNAGGRARLDFTIRLSSPVDPPLPAPYGEDQGAKEPPALAVNVSGSPPPVTAGWVGPGLAPPIDPDPLAGISAAVGKIKPGALAGPAKPLSGRLAGPPKPLSGRLAGELDAEPLGGFFAAAGRIKPGSLAGGPNPAGAPAGSLNLSGAAPSAGLGDDPLAGISAAAGKIKPGALAGGSNPSAAAAAGPPPAPGLDDDPLAGISAAAGKIKPGALAGGSK